MSSILILPSNVPDPDLTVYRPIRQTRRYKYYTKIDQPDPSEEEMKALMDSLKDLSFEEEESYRKKGGSKRRTRRKSRKSRKSRKYRK